MDTSVWNFYFADDAPEKRDITRTFFHHLPEFPYKLFISRVVLDEIRRAPSEIKERLMGLIQRCRPEMLDLPEDVYALAQKYHDQGAIPKSMPEDALHVACATVAELDAVVSWNLKHLANLQKQERVHGVNLLSGYHKPLYLVTPAEVMSYE